MGEKYETIKTPFGDSVTTRKHEGPGAVMKETLKMYLTSGWMFNKWYEKIILMAAFWWAVWCLIKLVI